MTLRFALAAALAALSLGTPPASALTPVRVASGLTDPLFLTAPAGDPRLFVVEKGGAIKVIQGGVGVPWFDLSAKIDAAGERGLLGLAFDPGFASNGRFYVNYIDKTTKNTVVERYTVPVPSSGAPDPNSAQAIITIAQPAGRTNHKAGWIGFRPTDPGNLYIATGDGGSSNDPDNVAQNKSNDLGKVLRVTPGTNGGYTVPADNPFVGVIGNDEIWSFGLRNPFRSSFDRQTGDFWIADVGQGLREEVNFETASTLGGRNYGWRAREGAIDNPGVPDAAPPGAVEPLFDYGRNEGGSIIGGYVYRGGADATIEGLYFFGDFVSGRIWSGRLQGGAFVDKMLRTDLQVFDTFELTSFGEDRFGGLYVMGRDGNVYLIAAGVPEPSALALMFVGLLALIALARSRARGAASSGAR